MRGSHEHSGLWLPQDLEAALLLLLEDLMGAGRLVDRQAVGGVLVDAGARTVLTAPGEAWADGAEAIVRAARQAPVG